MYVHRTHLSDEKIYSWSVKEFFSVIHRAEISIRADVTVKYLVICN